MKTTKEIIIVYGRKINISTERGLKSAFNRYGKMALYCKHTDEKEFQNCCEQMRIILEKAIKKNIVID